MTKPTQITALIAACVGIAGATHVIRMQLVRAESANFEEFTITRVERSVGHSPYPIERMVLEAQRADGSRVTSQVPPADSGHPARRFVWLVPERIRAEVNDTLRARSTLYLEDGPAPRPSAPDPQCGFSRLALDANPSYRGEAEVLGFRTVVVQTEHRNGENESLLHTDWKAVDLGCVVLKATEDRRDNSGAVSGHFELQAIKVILGPPDPKLFDIPQDYAELSPSQMYDALVGTFGNLGRPAPAKMRLRLEREDQRYFANHEQSRD